MFSARSAAPEFEALNLMAALTTPPSQSRIWLKEKKLIFKFSAFLCLSFLLGLGFFSAILSLRKILGQKI